MASAPSHEDDSDEDDVAISSQPKKGLQLLETVGTGGYGVVYRAIWHGQLIAAKVIEHDDTRGDGLITKDDSFCPFERGDTADGGARPRRASLACVLRVPLCTQHSCLFTCTVHAQSMPSTRSRQLACPLGGETALGTPQRRGDLESRPIQPAYGSQAAPASRSTTRSPRARFRSS